MTTNSGSTRLRLGILGFTLVLSSASLALAAHELFLPRTVSGGGLVLAPDGVTSAEHLVVDPGLVPTLLSVGIGERVSLADWPLAPGLRGDVQLERRDFYAPGAEIYVVDGKSPHVAAHSTLAFFVGAAAGNEAVRVLLSVDPSNKALSAYIRSEEGWSEMRPIAPGSPDFLLAPEKGFIDPSVGQPVYGCGQSEAEEALDAPILPQSGTGGSEATTALRQLTLAVDTDNELLGLKFSDNTTNATNYIASLIALMSVIYERDLQVRLLQGTTFLRVSTTPDPYAQSGTGNADTAKLSEFRNYWSANYGSVSRAATMLLSGKQSSATSASGIAYINGLCSTNTGYSFSQVFKYSGSSASSDTLLVAHEVGHNFGSPHTHCYSPPIDTCYNGESGCYAGATSCPAPQTINGVTNVRGTLMSYCHRLGGCSAAAVFHPQTVARVSPIVDSKIGVCVFPATTSNPKEASPLRNMTAARGGAGSVAVTYAPACGATQHTAYAGNLDTLRSAGIAWSQRFCSLGSSGSLSFTPAGNVYFVVAGNNGTKEGSYGPTSSGERPAAGSGGACSFTQDLTGSCP